MKITFSELKARKDKTIDLLEIVSLEGRYYLARLKVDGQTRVLTDDQGEPLLYTGSRAAQDALSAFPIARTEVLPQSGYEEMVGQEDNAEPFMRVPVHRPK